MLLTSRKELISHESIYFWYDLYPSLTGQRDLGTVAPYDLTETILMPL